MRTTTGSVHSYPTQPTTPAYPPSVPLSVYRELATELQTVQTKLDKVTTKNQQLAQENQQSASRNYQSRSVFVTFAKVG